MKLGDSKLFHRHFSAMKKMGFRELVFKSVVFVGLLALMEVMCIFARIFVNGVYITKLINNYKYS